MAVGAPDLALGDLNEDGLPGEVVPQHEPDVAFILAAHVVELEGLRVSLAAILAAVGPKVPEDLLADHAEVGLLPGQDLRLQARVGPIVRSGRAGSRGGGRPARPPACCTRRFPCPADRGACFEHAGAV